MLCLHLTHQSVAVPASRPPAQITTKQLIELFFSSQAGGHCKNIPTLEYGFLVQVRPVLANIVLIYQIFVWHNHKHIFMCNYVINCNVYLPLFVSNRNFRYNMWF